jgi:2-amino-4-hydroxy-6-hydroxymethyldihydropteridine diphosphokinase
VTGGPSGLVPHPLGDATAPTPVVLALGANLGDRAGAIRRALELLAPDAGPFRTSDLYETPPWGDADQPAFLNLVAAGATCLGPAQLLHRCKGVEHALGRQPERRWGPRAIDVDVLAYGDLWLRTSDLEVPHARLHQRGFVLVPLAELLPDWRHPLLGRTASELLATLPVQETQGITRWRGDDPADMPQP